jgi:hypothetical protein
MGRALAINAAHERDPSMKVILPRVRLHPLVRAYNDMPAVAKLRPKEISHKIYIDFARDSMFLQSPAVCDIIAQQIGEHIHLVHEKQSVQ